MSREGPDIACSMDPAALSDLIRGSQIIYRARGGEKCPVDAEAPTIAFASASVVAIRDILPGQLLSEENIWLMRPGGGDFCVTDYESLLGRPVSEKVKKGYQLRKEQVK